MAYGNAEVGVAAVQMKAVAVLEEVLTVLIRVRSGLTSGSFSARWSLQQVLKAGESQPSKDAAVGQRAAERMCLLCATVNVAANVTNALNQGRLGGLVPVTAAQVKIKDKLAAGVQHNRAL